MSEAFDFEYVEISEEQALILEEHWTKAKAVASIAFVVPPCEGECEHLGCEMQKDA